MSNLIVSPVDHAGDALVETLLDELNGCKFPTEVFLVADRIDKIAQKIGDFDSIQWAFIKDSIKTNMTRTVEHKGE